MPEPDVVVAGYGPVGALLALRLGRLGLRCLVVERAAEVFPLPRAVALDDEAAHLLSLAAPGVLAGALTDRPVRFLDRAGRRLGEIRFPSAYPQVSGLSFIEQPDVEARLRAEVAALPGVEVRLGVAVTGLAQDSGGVDVALSQGAPVRAAWLVGCDGAASTVRAAAGIAWKGRDLPSRWLVADLGRPVPGRDGFTYRCDPDLPRVDLPVPGGHRFEWLLRAGREPDLRALLGADGLSPDGLAVRRAVVYRFGARRAAAWRSGRVLLAGDAAHTMPPFAGQGLSAGIRDAWSLSRRLAEGDPDGYERERAPHVRQMTLLSLFLGAVVQSRCAAVRDPLLRGAFAAPGLGPWLSRGGPRRTASGVLPPGA